MRAAIDFKLRDTASVRMHKLRSFDLHVVPSLSPEIVILETGTNDLPNCKPEVVGSAIEDLVVLILGQFSVRVVGVCQVIPRGQTHADSEFFDRSRILNQYLEVVSLTFWQHSAFSHPSKLFYLPGGVHLNPQGQYLLYRSYRGAILYAVTYFKGGT